MRLAYQGEPGAYSEAAALLYGGADVETLPCKSFDDVFEAVERKRATHGVVPLENSIGGTIHRNYDLLLEHDLPITGEVDRGSEKSMPEWKARLSLKGSTRAPKLLDMLAAVVGTVSGMAFSTVTVSSSERGCVIIEMHMRWNGVFAPCLATMSIVTSSGTAGQSTRMKLRSA